MAKRDSEATLKILKEAKSRFKRCENWEATARQRYTNDIKFCEGDSDNLYQWPDDIRQRLEDDTRPVLTINKTRQHCLDVLNDARQSKVAVKISPTGGGSSYESAQVYMGVIRHIEYISNAATAYQHALACSVKGGWGYWRLITDYANDNSFDQEIFIRRIRDPLSVYLDPDIHEVDGSDARFGFVFTDIPKDEFEAQYPSMKGQLPADSLDPGTTWVRENTVRVAEYFRRVEHKERLIAYSDPQKPGEMQVVRESQLAPTIVKALLRDPSTQVRTIKSHKVEWYKIAGDTIVDERPWPGIYIPIVRCIGEETVIDGQMDRKGHTRALKDAQRMFNYNAPLDLQTPLPTPTGWTTMGDVERGDWLLDERGAPVRVLGTSPVFINRPCYRVEFDDGSHIIADGEHRWTVEERVKRTRRGFDWAPKVICTEELEPKKHFIYVTEALDLAEAALPVDPYVLGVWLGDGSRRDGHIVSGLDDMEEMRSLLAESGYEVGAPRVYGDKAVGEIRVAGLYSKLRRAGLLGNKHVPEPYLRASRAQRLALLQGLMDTDGNVSKAKQCSFTNTNPRIVAAFAELLRTLGLKATSAHIAGAAAMFPDGQIRVRQDATRFAFSADPTTQIFRLSRKRKVQEGARLTHARRTKRHRIVSVTPAPSVPVKCIGVDNESHLFLAGVGMVPTHNSGAVEFGALQSKTPYISPADAIEGYETYWDTANTANHSVLPYNHRDDDGEPIPPPQRQTPPTGAPVFMQGMIDAAEWMRMVSGQYQADMGAPGNERSGVAIQQRQRQGDNATYHYLDHQSIAIRLTAKMLIDLIPKVYDTERVMEIMDENGNRSKVRIDPNQSDAMQKVAEDREEVAAIFNPKVGQYEVQGDVGPAFATARQDAWNAYVQILTQNKELVSIIGDLAFKCADFPGADEIAQRLKRMVPQQALQDGPSPDVVAAQQQIEALQGLIKQLAEKLADKTADHLNDQEQNAIKGYDAQTKRIAALKDALNTDPEGLVSLVRQVIMEAEATSGASLAPALEVTPPVTAQDMLPAPPQQPMAGPGEMPMGAPDVDPGNMGAGPAASPGGAPV